MVTWSSVLPGFRAVKYVQHSGPPPKAVLEENQDWFTCQTEPVPVNLDDGDRNKDVVAIHEKEQTCTICIWVFPLCCSLPYLTSKSADGTKVYGTTRYVCDMCCFVPKYDVLDASGKPLYLIRPDTCVAGMCVQRRCNGAKSKGKCLRVPFVVRNPETKEPITEEDADKKRPVQVDNLWAGWKHECCND